MGGTCLVFFFFFLNDPAPPEIYPLPLHDALPIFLSICSGGRAGPYASVSKHPGHPAPETCSSNRRLPFQRRVGRDLGTARSPHATGSKRSEEHTSELQSRLHLVCRLLLEKKNRPMPNASSRSLSIASTLSRRRRTSRSCSHSAIASRMLSAPFSSRQLRRRPKARSFGRSRRMTSTLTSIDRDILSTIRRLYRRSMSSLSTSRTLVSPPVIIFTSIISGRPETTAVYIFFFKFCAPHRIPPSFPTRRSSN